MPVLSCRLPVKNALAYFSSNEPLSQIELDVTKWYECRTPFMPLKKPTCILLLILFCINLHAQTNTNATHGFQRSVLNSINKYFADTGLVRCIYSAGSGVNEYLKYFKKNGIDTSFTEIIFDTAKITHSNIIFNESNESCGWQRFYLYYPVRSKETVYLLIESRNSYFLFEIKKRFLRWKIIHVEKDYWPGA